MWSLKKNIDSHSIEGGPGAVYNVSFSSPEVACVASVSVGFGSKERPRNGVFGILPARKMGREPKKERWG